MTSLVDVCDINSMNNGLLIDKFTGKVINSDRFIHIITNKKLNKNELRSYLKENEENIKNLRKGSCMPTILTSDLKQFKINIQNPNKEQ